MTNTTEETIELLDELNGGPLTFGQLLNAVRTGEGMSEQSFADLIGYTVDGLAYLERDVVDIADADRVAAALGDSPRIWIDLAIQARFKLREQL